MFNVSGSDGSVGQSDCVMQIYARKLSNEVAYVIQPGRTHGYVKKPPSVNGRIGGDLCGLGTVKYLRMHFAFLSYKISVCKL